MGGGLMQLVAYGAQDAYLTGNPQITFKVVYRAYNNFAWNVFSKLLPVSTLRQGSTSDMLLFQGMVI